MAILWIEGFEMFNGGADVAERNLNEVQLLRKYDSSSIGDNFRYVTGHNSARGVRGGRVGEFAILTKDLGATYNEIYTSFSFYLDSAVAGTVARFLEYQLSGSAQCSLLIRSDGTIDMLRGTATVLQSTAAATFPTDTWVYVEWYVNIANAGSWDVRLNGASVLANSGDTQNAGSPGASRVLFRFEDQANGLGGPGVMGLDNYIIQDDTGDFLIQSGSGSFYVEGLYPNDVGAAEDFANSGSGDNENFVDEVPADDDTTYVQSATPGDQDLYGFTDLTTLASGFTIYGIQINTTAFANSSEDLITLIRSGGTIYSDAGQAPGTSYECITLLTEIDPDTSAAWAEAAINAAQFGIEVG